MRVAPVLVALLVCAAMAAVVAGQGGVGSAATQVGTDTGPEPTAEPTPAPIDPASTNLTVRLRPNGDAAWTVTIALGLSGPNETRAFRDFAERYETGRAEVGPSLSPFEAAIGAASEGIEREMSLLDPTRSARVENDTGYLTLRFVWTNFADENAGRLRVGDAFRTPRGTWLPGLATNQTLLLVGPPGYGVNSAPIGPSNGTLRWEGAQEFEPGYLSVTYRRGLRETTTPTTPATPASGSEGGLDGAFVPLAGVALVGAGLLAALYARSRGVAVPGREGIEGDGVEHDAKEGGESPSDARSSLSGEDSGSATADVESGAEDASSALAGIDEELLSDEERVERLLEVNGGRMRQAAIVTETQWSNAKVSQLLSGMDRADRIDKLRIGRENLISLPDADTGDAENR